MFWGVISAVSLWVMSSASPPVPDEIMGIFIAMNSRHALLSASCIDGMSAMSMAGMIFWGFGQ